MYMFHIHYIYLNTGVFYSSLRHFRGVSALSKFWFSQADGSLLLMACMCVTLCDFCALDAGSNIR